MISYIILGMRHTTLAPNEIPIKVLKYWIGVGWLTNIFNKMLCKQKQFITDVKEQRRFLCPFGISYFFKFLKMKLFEKKTPRKK